MPKNTQHVEYNDSGDWKFALVTGQQSPGNLNLCVKDDESGGWTTVNNVPEGTASGHWREP